ncbi:MAG: putative bifunctional diguanylate cyclase/phosphodiesterase [Hyphomicrobiaceae bacterium]
MGSRMMRHVITTTLQARKSAGRGGLLALLLLLAIVGQTESVWALKALEVNPDLERMELTTLGEAHDARGDTLQIETAPGADGIAGRMSVRAVTPGTNPTWFVFALTNPTDKPMERWLTAERYDMIGSGVVWPDLDARRIESVTPSVGYVPERIKSDRADIFRLNLEPGQTVTFVAELSSERFARPFLWKPIEFEQRSRDRQLFNGIMLGTTGLLALFLTVIFAANHKAIFPTAALFTWSVVAYLCVDFNFWHKLFNIRPEENAQYRAAAEAAMAATLLIFTHTFLRLGLWHGFVRMVFGLWMAAQVALIAIAFLDPRLAATFARISSVAIGGTGGALILYLALRGQDRALSLVPAWILLLVWLFGVGISLTGQLTTDIAIFGIVSGLVLIVILVGFIVTQYAFRAAEPTFAGTVGEQQVRSLAIDSAGAAVWEWNARRDEIKVSPIVEAGLGLNVGELNCKVDDFAKHMHPADKERFRLLLRSVKERAGGEVRIDFRMRHVDNSYRWFDLEAASVPTSDRRTVRCVGLLREVTDAKRAQERLLHDAVHDSLTGAPNRELFLDRVSVACTRAKLEPLVRPSILFIDLDKFKSINRLFGLVVGDSLLLTVARRIARHLGPQDTLGRLGGDQFALLMVNHSDQRELAGLAEEIRRSLRAPVTIAGQEIVLTASIGIAQHERTIEDPAELLRQAEIAMYRARQSGPDQIAMFDPSMRGARDEQSVLEEELERAIEKRQLKLLYQPIMYLPTEELAGFEALVRWEHPRLGLLNPIDFIPIAEKSDLIIKLGSFVLQKAVEDALGWQREVPRPDSPLFVSVNVSTRQLFRQDLVNEVRHILGKSGMPRGALRLEITESLLMENPEQATQVLSQLMAAGAGLSIDDFGAGYSSLSYLHQFPFDTMKVDRGLVQAGSGEGAGSVIMRSIVALAHELGKKVVAEGVETEDDAALLRSIGCEYAQGFYYGEPMGEREVHGLLKLVRKTERRSKRRGLTHARRKPRERAPAQVAGAPPSAQPAVAAVARNGAGSKAGGPPPPPRPAGAPPLPKYAQARRRPMQSEQPAGRPSIKSPTPSAPPAGGPPPPRNADGPPTIPVRTGPVSTRGPTTEPPTGRPPRQPPGVGIPPPPPVVRPAAAARTNGTGATVTTTQPPTQPPPTIPRPAAASPPPSMRPAHPASPQGQSLDFSKLPPAVAQSLARLAGVVASPPASTGRPPEAAPLRDRPAGAPQQGAGGPPQDMPPPTGRGNKR